MESAIVFLQFLRYNQYARAKRPGMRKMRRGFLRGALWRVFLIYIFDMETAAPEENGGWI